MLQISVDISFSKSYRMATTTSETSTEIENFIDLSHKFVGSFHKLSFY